MSPETAGIVGIVLLLVLFLIRVQIAFAMAIMGFIGILYLAGLEPALTLLAQDIYESFTSYPLSVIPMFVLMGSFAFASGISKRLYDTTYTWVGHLRGGLTIATVLACSSFSAFCHSLVYLTASFSGSFDINEATFSVRSAFIPASIRSFSICFL